MASHEGTRKNGMMVGENFQTQRCQVASHALGLPVGLFSCLFLSWDFSKLLPF